MKLDFNTSLKEKILKDFNLSLYKKFNLGLDDLRKSLNEDELGLLDEVLDCTFEDGGPKELRLLINEIIKILLCSRDKKNNPKPPNNIKPVRFNKPFRPVFKRKRKEDPNQMKMNFNF